MRALVVALTLCVASRVFAQAPGEAKALSRPSQPKSPTLAVLLCIPVTAAGAFMVAYGFIHDDGAVGLAGVAGMYIGPSIGQWYAGDLGTIGLAGRTVGGLAVIAGGTQLRGASGSAARVDSGLISTGLALWAGATVYDFISARRAASRWNAKHALAIAPLVVPGRGQTTGVSLSFQF